MLELGKEDVKDINNYIQETRRQIDDQFKLDFRNLYSRSGSTELSNDYLIGEVQARNEEIISMKGNLEMLLTYAETLLKALEGYQIIKQRMAEKDDTISELKLNVQQLKSTVYDLEGEIESRLLIIEKLEIDASKAEEYFMKASQLEEDIDKIQDKYQNNQAFLEGNIENLKRAKKIIHRESLDKLHEMGEKVKASSLQTESLHQIIDKMKIEEKFNSRQIIHLKEKITRLKEECATSRDVNINLEGKMIDLENELESVRNIINPILSQTSTLSEREQIKENNQFSRLDIFLLGDKLQESKKAGTGRNIDVDKQLLDYDIEEDEFFGAPVRQRSRFGDPQGLFCGNFQHLPSQVLIPCKKATQTRISYIQNTRFMEITTQDLLSINLTKVRKDYQTEIQHEFINASKTSQTAPDMLFTYQNSKELNIQINESGKDEIQTLQYDIPNYKEEVSII